MSRTRTRKRNVRRILGRIRAALQPPILPGDSSHAEPPLEPQSGPRFLAIDPMPIAARVEILENFIEGADE